MHRTLLPVAVVTVIVLIFLVPLVPSKAASQAWLSPLRSASSIPPNSWCEADPTGTRCGGILGNGTYTMSLSTYNSMLNDPYSHWCSNHLRFEGDTVYLTCPNLGIQAGGAS
jgi:hypothetical protein